MEGGSPQSIAIEIDDDEKKKEKEASDLERNQRTKELQDLRNHLKKLMIRQLRDYDFNVRIIATEGFCKLLMCEKMNDPQDILSRLILIKFDAAREGSNLDQLLESNKGNVEQEKLLRERQHSLN